MKGEEKKGLQEEEGEDTDKQYSLYQSEDSGVDKKNMSNEESFRNTYYDQQADENASNKSDQSDDEKMNVFGFNDELAVNLDDRIIIQNPTENAKYNLVERPKYLLQFEQSESESEFLFKISK